MIVAVPTWFDHLCLLRRKEAASAAHPSTRPRRRQSSHGPLADKLFLELRQRGEEMEDQPACGRTGVKPLFETNEVNATLVELVDDAEQVTDRATKPVQAPNDQRVASIQTLKALHQFRSLGRSATHLFLVDALAACLPQLRHLSFRVLVFRRDTGVANHHASRYHKRLFWTA